MGALAQRIGCSMDDITDMSCNLNPMGPMPDLEAYIRANTGRIGSLPEPDAGTMVTAYAQYHDMDPQRVIAGNGTTAFIYTLPAALASKNVLIAGPTYADYRDGCIMNNTPFAFWLADKSRNFQLDTEGISATLSRSDNAIDTVIICNPNNPTGTLVEQGRLVALVEEHPGVFFVIDESYLPFTDHGEAMSLARETGFPNLVVLSSMSKIFTIPGLRTGFLSAHPDVVKRFMAYYQPWSVNALAQAAVVHLLENRETTEAFVSRSRSFMKEEKALFYETMSRCSGIKLFPSTTYFVLAELLKGTSAVEVCRIVGNERMLIRNCANFHGLSDRFVRFSLKDRKSNTALAAALKSIEAIH